MRQTDLWRATRQHAQELRTRMRSEQERAARLRAQAVVTVERSKLVIQDAEALCAELQGKLILQRAPRKRSA